MFSEEQERAQVFISSSDGSIDKNMHYQYRIRAYNRIGFSDSGTQDFSKLSNLVPMQTPFTQERIINIELTTLTSGLYTCFIHEFAVSRL